MNIYIDNYSQYYPQYEYKVLCVDNDIKNISELRNTLETKYVEYFKNYVDYKYFKIIDIKKFRWTWNYINFLEDSNLEELTDDITNVKDVFIFNHHSQYNEDYIIEKIFDNIGILNKSFVDVGSKDGKFISNVYKLIKQGWSGLLIDPIADVNLSNDKLTFLNINAYPDNIIDLLNENEVLLDFDFLNIDIDGNDIHISKSIISKYCPRVICIEVNALNQLYKKEYCSEYNCENSIQQQASILSVMKILNNDYTLVYNNGGNAFFVINVEMDKLVKLNDEDIKKYILKCRNEIKENLGNITSHYMDRMSRYNTFNKYLKYSYEEHYPYILRYKI
jgi:hypothetical protein